MIKITYIKIVTFYLMVLQHDILESLNLIFYQNHIKLWIPNNYFSFFFSFLLIFLLTFF